MALIKKVRAKDIYELVYLVRLSERENWTRGDFKQEQNYNGSEWVCYMTMKNKGC